MEELVKFILSLDDCAGYLVDRYTERKKSVEALSKRLNQRQI
jgi:arsenic resistance protein ArsH